MTQKYAMQLFEEQKVRIVWDTDLEKYFFSIIDVIRVLTDSDRPRKYWNDLKKKLLQEGSELSDKIGQLKMQAEDGKRRMTDVADTEQLFRLIQSVPSPKAEPFKQWMAQVAAQRIDQLQDPELSINQAIADYRRLGYSEAWINQRIKSIEVRKALTDEWHRAGVEEGQQYASLTDIIYQQWSGFTSKEYKQFKGLKKENLRDNMTNVEITLNMLAEASATELSQQENPQGFAESAGVALRGGKVAQTARQQLEKELGRSVVSSKNAKALAAKNKVIQLPPAEEK
ncbi:MAG: Bro-N domain-containing protein [Bacteroidales bacterium]|nr:Bro-N domain-containing protein [Bacteroidales bacterium]